MSERHALSTPRLRMLPVVPEHAELTWPYLRDERMWEFFPALRPPTIEALRRRYERWSNEMPYLDAPERWENWLCLQHGDARAVGEAQATYAGTTVYIAYSVFPPFRRHGFAREAMSEVLRHAHESHGSRNAICEMAAANDASIAVAEALGFERVKTREQTESGLGYTGKEYVYRRILS
jgi:RimJ/RimL family protein N-acetyltransferase